MDELLANGAVEPSTGGTGLYSRIFVVSKYMVGLYPILKLKQFNHCVHILTLRSLLSDRYTYLFKKEIMFFLLILRMLIYIFLLLNITVIFTVCLATQTASVESSCLFGWIWPLGFAPHSLNLYCSYAITRVYMLLYTWKIYWSLLTPGMLTRELRLSCAVFWFILDYILIFQIQNSISHSSCTI